MQQFKVGDRVKVRDIGEGVIVEIFGKWHTCPHIIQIDNRRGQVCCAEYELTLIPQPQTIYAVCDENGEVIHLDLYEETVWESYCGNTNILPKDKGYTIRPFHLTPINE